MCVGGVWRALCVVASGGGNTGSTPPSASQPACGCSPLLQELTLCPKQGLLPACPACPRHEARVRRGLTPVTAPPRPSAQDTCLHQTWCSITLPSVFCAFPWLAEDTRGTGTDPCSPRTLLTPGGPSRPPECVGWLQPQHVPDPALSWWEKGGQCGTHVPGIWGAGTCSGGGSRAMTGDCERGGQGGLGVAVPHSPMEEGLCPISWVRK